MTSNPDPSQLNILILRYRSPYITALMRYTEEHIAEIKAIVPHAHVTVIDPTKELIDRHLPEADILILSPLDHSTLIDFSLAKKLTWVHISASGANNIASRLKNNTIMLTNSSGVHPIPIAEHVFTFMLMLARQFTTSYRNQIDQKCWVQEDIATGITELYQNTVGIVGKGRVGSRVAKIAKAFDMRVISLIHSTTEKTDDSVDIQYRQDQLSTLLGESDFVVNCLPLTSETEGFFNGAKFRQMKKSAYFINVGRGKTVVENDLIESLENEDIKGAGLDVFVEEPLPPISKLWHLKNVVITPHFAGWTPKYIDRVVHIFCNNLKEFMKHKPMPTLVNKDKGY